MAIKDLINKGYTVYKEENNELVEISNGYALAFEIKQGAIIIVFALA